MPNDRLHKTNYTLAYGFLMLERLAGKKIPLPAQSQRGGNHPLDSQRLPYPKASARVGLGPRQRHVPWSIATVRFRLARAIA